ncbi:MAG: deoxyribodipyrimidine photolyase [Deltaproteobacteria bacterium]|nr:deoxyribodipyrimidine photolyase [Deltaproteobacteria bacterium]
MTSLEKLAQDPRVTVRRGGTHDSDGRCVVYWMQRAQRATDNPALNLAIRAANCLQKPVVVFFRLAPRSIHANLRHYHFMAQGFRDLALDLNRKKIGFVLRRAPEGNVAAFSDEVRPCLVVGDENPMKESEDTKDVIASRLRVPFWTVDADVIVPSRLLSKEHYAARTLRPRIKAHLEQFLVPFTKTAPRVPWKDSIKSKPVGDAAQILDGFSLDRSVQPVFGFVGGPREAQKSLDRFLRDRLKGYAIQRNRPELDGTSQLSPYLHFGHIGPHRVALAVKNSQAPRADRDAFLEEFIVRRELAINFVRYNPRYDRVDCWEPWANRSLTQHAGDARKPRYTEKQLEWAETHDPLWNAAQKQMVLTGWMHGYLRMYWAKKILEWSPSPKAAYETAVWLNDRYELDGRDPNGYAGIAWAVVGKHDRAWGPERQVFGKIRYMSYESTSRKFDSKTYIDRIRKLER